MKPVQSWSCFKNVLGIPCQINDDSLGLVDAQSMASPFFPKCIVFPFLNPKQLCPSLVYSISGHKTGLWIFFLARGHKCVCVCSREMEVVWENVQVPNVIPTSARERICSRWFHTFLHQ